MITFDDYFLPLWLPLSFLVLAILVWITTLLLTSMIGGWLRLADKFPLRVKPNSRPLSYVSGSLNYGVRARLLTRANYGRILKVWINQEGLTLALLLIFRPAHPPIQLPWSAIRRSDSDKPGRITLIVDSPATTIVLRGKAAEAVRSKLQELAAITR